MYDNQYLRRKPDIMQIAKKRVLIIIPSHNPNEQLLETIYNLISNGFINILVIDDGSKRSCQHFFNKINQYEGITVLRHFIKLGNDRALKTALNYYMTNKLNNMKYMDCIGILTVTADNRYSTEDIFHMACALVHDRQAIILGCRDFSHSDIAWQSRWANRFVSSFLRLLCGLNVTDSQTALRAIPDDLIPYIFIARGDEFEYETNMLLECQQKNIDITEIKLRSSHTSAARDKIHFNPFKISFKMYIQLLKFLSSSISSFVVDITFFTLSMWIFSPLDKKFSILLSTIIARILSSLYNYLINKYFTFRKKNHTQGTLFRYYSLCVIQMFISYAFVYWLGKIIGINSTIVKIFVDEILFVLSFQIQREWVFKSK
jgi:dolichol-phosphate mannosyltransferase